MYPAYHECEKLNEEEKILLRKYFVRSMEYILGDDCDCDICEEEFSELEDGLIQALEWNDISLIKSKLQELEELANSKRAA